MRAVPLIVVLAACGRLGFGETGAPSVDGGGDAIPGDGASATPQFCAPRVVTTLLLEAAQPVAMRAVALGDAAYAVAIETSDTGIPLLELDAAGELVARHAPFSSGYAPLYGISRHGDRPVVHLMSAGESYLKFVNADWESYTTGANGVASPIDPAYAETAAGTGIGAQIRAGSFDVGRIDDSELGWIMNADYTPTSAVGGSLVPIPAGARVVVEQAGGVCETFVVSVANMTSGRFSFSPCYAPVVAAADDTTGVILHRTSAGGPFALRMIPAAPTDPPRTFSLAGATSARIATRDDGAYWVAHGSDSYRALARITPAGEMTEHREDVAAGMFDLTAREAFWLHGATVHVSTPCLR